MNDVLAPDFKSAPYWWDAAPPEVLDGSVPGKAYDVVVVGAGFTGLSAALQLLRAGRSVVVLDREQIGLGASRRNAGFLGRVIKKPFCDLLASHGPEHAKAVYSELNAALAFTFRLIEEEGIECYANRCGRFVAANSPAHYEILARECASMEQHLGFPYHMVSRDEQRTEFASDVYHGGAVIPDLGSLHPGLYHQGLVARVREAGGALCGGCEVLGIDQGTGRKRLRLRTSRGDVMAEAAVIATNGYTSKGLKWHARRLVPFTGFMAATEELTAEQLAHAIPNRRTVLDAKTNIDFFRPAPDSPRILFGGATGSRLQGTREIAERLHLILRSILPELAGVRLSHVWEGQCAGTFDMMPHIGQRAGVWYGMGYNFAGVPMGSYFGHKIAQQILGDPRGSTVFAKGGFPTVPFYSGNPWFVPYVMRYFDWKDRRTAEKSLRAGR